MRNLHLDLFMYSTIKVCDSAEVLVFTTQLRLLYFNIFFFIFVSDYIIIGCVFGVLVLCLVAAKLIKWRGAISCKKEAIASDGSQITSYDKQTDDVYVVP